MQTSGMKSRKQTFSWEILAAAAHDRLPGLVGGVGSATPGAGG